MKILIIRFSSIGDIVLTTPVIRSIKEQIEDVTIHYITKSQFTSILDQNPNISKIYSINKSIDEVLPQLKSEHYDYIIDLHNNIRTQALKKKLGVKSFVFRKLNWKKWVLVKFKSDRLPKIHVVDRYYEAVKSLGVKNDRHKGDYYISQKDVVNIHDEFGFNEKEYYTMAIGAQYKTKCMPYELIIDILGRIDKPVVLIGGETDLNLANKIASTAKNAVNACGKYSLSQSASIVHQSLKLVTNDTGMMHIASCFDIPIISVWGNTVPSFGMYPYTPESKRYSIHEVDGLNCRPCSKIGYQKCPKGHFNCMLKQDSDAIAKDLLS